MSAHRHDEFSLHVTWRGRPGATPGFYLTVGWANEGVADWWTRDQHLTVGELRQILLALPTEDAVDDAVWRDVIARMIREATEAAQAEVDRLRYEKARIEAELKILEGRVDA